MHYLVIAIIIVMTAFNVFVEALNYRNRNQELPDNVKGLYDEAKYSSWLKYTMENFRLGIIRSVVMTLVLVSLLLSGFFGVLETLVMSMTGSATFQIALFLWFVYLIITIIGIPFRYHKTFVIEEKYGFNKTTKGLFFFDILKSLVLASVLGGGAVTLLGGVFIAFADKLVLLLLISYLVIVGLTVLVFLLSGVFIRAFNKMKPLEAGSLKDKINELALKLGFSIKRIYVMDASKRSTKLNAFFTGLGKTREVALYDTLVENMTEAEIIAVLAHELGHATYKDSLKLLIRQNLVFAIYVVLLGLILSVETFFTGFGLAGVNYGFALLLLILLIEPLDVLIGILLNHLSRVAEYRADAFAKKHADAASIQGALKKLAVANYANLTPHPLYQLLHYSHPTISKRLSAIERNE